MTGSLESLNGDNVHVVLLGDSTLDNGRYLDLAQGELSVEKQLHKRCMERGWNMTVLAQDGSLLDDVRLRQIPLIPECATHIVLSASGNDLLSLLNEMVVANFTLSSMYATIGNGLNQVAENYRDILRELKGLGCHLSCCTLYRPNFNHLFFKSLASFSLGLHNSRIKQISIDLDCSVIDFANIFDGGEDFANPLELSTIGGAKLVENVSAFIADHPISMLSRRSHTHIYLEDEAALAESASRWGLSLTCCSTRVQQRRVYARTALSETLQLPDKTLADADLGPALAFSQEQERWRNIEDQPAPPEGLKAS
jgi:hypothetical protein